jgi:hypothetical protein
MCAGDTGRIGNNLVDFKVLFTMSSLQHILSNEMERQSQMVSM